jgi:tartrate-resistant acid phosphatase type 5
MKTELNPKGFHVLQIPRLSRRNILKLGVAGTAALFKPSVVFAGAIGSALSFFVIGDWGDPKAQQKEVARAMVVTAAQTPPRLIISVGDNFYPRGVTSAKDELWKVAFQEVYDQPSLDLPWYAVLGNHDRKGNVEAQSEFGKIDPRWHMPSRYYSHIESLAEGGDVEFFFLDTTLVVGGEVSAETDQIQFDWLDSMLTQSRAQWRIVVGHHPVFSGGHHGGTPALVDRLKPLLDRHKVQVYLSGHDHDMQHILVDGVHYLVSGSGSKTRSTGKIDSTLFAASELGFLNGTLISGRLEVRFIGIDGAVLHSAAIAVIA